MSFNSFLRRLRQDSVGAVVVEIAILTPVLAVLALGGFDAGVIVMRHQELQSALSDGEAIALAANQGAETNITEIKSIIMDEVRLSDNQITLSKRYRCGTSSNLVTNPDACDEESIVSEYVRFEIRETRTPLWTKFGIAGPIELNVERMVQLS